MSAPHTIIIIGATGGIGSVIARSCAERGMNVVLSARTEDKLHALAHTLGKAQTLVIPADASKAEDVEMVFAKSVERFGTIDAVVISAGTWKQVGLDESLTQAVELAKSHFQMYFLPSFAVAYAAQQLFRKQGFGLIANISSHAAHRSDLKGNMTYGPMKAAAHRAIQNLYDELLGTDVRVTDIAPAIVNTPDAALFLQTEEQRASAVQPEAIAEWIIENIDNPAIPREKHFDSSIVVA